MSDATLPKKMNSRIKLRRNEFGYQMMKLPDRKALIIEEACKT